MTLQKHVNTDSSALAKVEFDICKIFNFSAYKVEFFKEKVDWKTVVNFHFFLKQQKMSYFFF